MIPVTKPFLPPREEFNLLLEGIWNRNWLTNNGPLVNELELQLKKRLKIPHLLYVGNGTIAIQLALKCLQVKGEVITTPFSYVATTSSIVWEGFTPVFADIDGNTLNIDPSLIKKAITKDTVAILATHCFGNACNIQEIQTIAQENQLFVIYDAAHCYGTKYQGESIFQYGDISTTSFHATKLFHTTEGGAVIAKNPELIHAMALMRNFGHSGPESFASVGINGKNSEFHAAMGLSLLPHMNEILAIRKKQSLFYNELLENLLVDRPVITAECEYNYAYYPIIFPSEEALLKATAELLRHKVVARRYFYPSLSHLPYVASCETPVSDDISKRILCLPLYHTLSEPEQRLIARILLRAQKYDN